MAATKKTVKKAAPAKAARQGSKNVVKKATEVKAAGMAGKADSVRVRMYCHGFGDCFLLTFLSNGHAIYQMLIDCGMLTGESNRLKQVIEDIKVTCNGRLNLVVQTHEHKDHVSGFNLRDKDGSLLWDGIQVDRAWLAWTENVGHHGDELATQLKAKQDKKKKALAKALQLYNASMKQQQPDNLGASYNAAQQRFASSLQELLSFYDISEQDVAGLGVNNAAELGLKVKDAMQYFIQRRLDKGKIDINFWEPGQLADNRVTGLPGVNFYFLGPPKDYDKLRVMDDPGHVEMYLNEMGLSDNFFMALSGDAVANDSLSPFHRRYQWNTKDNMSPDYQQQRDNVWELYYGKDHAWRSIEADWLNNAGALALSLDSYTNNTSLAIAIELEDSGKVLLFPGDAQIGNWLSWTEAANAQSADPRLQWQVMRADKKETVTAAQLLGRTVFYKVGHHASHNATARKHGLELMNSEDLVAMIPVDEEVAKTRGKKGWKMPAEDLYKRLQEKTRSRIIRLDTGSLLHKGDSGDLPEGTRPSQQQLKDFRACFSESDIIISTEEGRKRPLYFEYTIKGRQ